MKRTKHGAMSQHWREAMSRAREAAIGQTWSRRPNMHPVITRMDKLASDIEWRPNLGGDERMKVAEQVARMQLKRERAAA